MDIDWTQIRGAIKRIENELSKAEKVIERTDADLVRNWQEVRREELEAAFPNWRTEFGPNWGRDFMEKKVGKANYRVRPGSRKYRIAPEAFRALNLGGPRPAGKQGEPQVEKTESG